LIDPIFDVCFSVHAERSFIGAGRRRIVGFISILSSWGVIAGSWLFLLSISLILKIFCFLMLHGGAVLNIGTASLVSGGGVMVDGRDWTHEFWNIDGEIVGVRLKERCFLNFAGSGV
jgi:hypothetical protein